MLTHAALSATDLWFSFGSTTALAGASLEVREGETVALLGPSGSGKSTLLYCLAGILSPQRGIILFRGRTVNGLTDRARTRLRRDSFGFVLQFGQLVHELTVLENVALSLQLKGVPRRMANREALVWLRRLGVEDLVARHPGQLSGGQQQRVAVARALVAQPEVIFADEPTGALDSINSGLVITSMTTLAREHGVAVVLVTHDAGIASIADRRVFLRDGRVVASDAA